MPVLAPPVRPLRAPGLKPGAAQDSPERRVPSVDELSAELERGQVWLANRMDPASDAVPRLQDGHPKAGAGQASRGSEAGRARAEHDDVDVIAHSRVTLGRLQGGKKPSARGSRSLIDPGDTS